MPLLNALALIVVVADTLSPAVGNMVLLLVGVVPFVVYLMVAPDVLQLSFTVCVPVYVPGVGLAVGVATFDCMV